MPPLVYEGRQVAQEVNRAGIDTWFDRVTRDLSDQQRADLKRKLARYSEIAQGNQTISAIAYDIAEHFIKFWQGTRWKAQFAVRTRAAAVKYKVIFDEMGTVSAEVIMSAPDDRSTGDDPAEEISEPVARFWKTMMAKYGGEEEYNRQIVEGFKKREEPELLIVVSKLLTGFDAPVNTVLYIDKPLAGHSLLQAIARVNRVEEDKEYGYIVDYAGVLGELDTAMRTYSALGQVHRPKYDCIQFTQQRPGRRCDAAGQQHPIGPRGRRPSAGVDRDGPEGRQLDRECGCPERHEEPHGRLLL